MSKTHAFFAGSVTAFNIQRHLSNVGKALSGEFDLHLVTTHKEVYSPNLNEYYTIYGDSNVNTRTGEVRVLKDYLRRHNPDSLTQITQPPIHGTMVGVLSSLFGDIEFVYRYNGDTFGQHNHDNGLTKYRNFLLYNVMGRTPLCVADEYIVLGKHGRVQLTERGVSNDLITSLPPMIDPERFKNVEPILIDDGTVFGFVGRVSRLKGVDTLKRTIGEIVKRRPNSRFVFVGQVEDTSLKERFPAHVEFVGPVPPSEVPSYLKSFDALIHPSLTEGIPRAVLESLFVSTPVIARNVGDLPEVSNNLFERDQELIDMACDVESLSVDDVYPFEIRNAKQDYIRFYENLSA